MMDYFGYKKGRDPVSFSELMKLVTPHADAFTFW